MSTTETLRITGKIIRKGRECGMSEHYYSYIAENKNHKHKLKTIEGTKLFEILKTTIVSKVDDRYNYKVYIDGVYYKGDLLYVTNFRKILS